MARFRLTLRFVFIPLIALLASLPGTAAAAGFFGPIIPQGLCAGKPFDWGSVLQVLQNLINVAVSLGVILMVLWIAYAGFMLMVSGGSAEARSQGKARIVNALVGLLVILTAWLLVDFVMKTIYDDKNVQFGPWNKILAGNGNDYCIRETTPKPITLGSVLTNITTVQPGTSLPSGVGVAQGLCSDSNTSCSPAVMKSEGLNDAQANAMSCIAVTESGGGSNKGNSGTGAQGLFQITLTNWNNPTFHRSPCSSSTSRLNDACNRQAAVLMFRSQGYQPWTGRCNQSRCGNVTYGQYWNPNAVACVNKYDP